MNYVQGIGNKRESVIHLVEIVYICYQEFIIKTFCYEPLILLDLIKQTLSSGWRLLIRDYKCLSGALPLHDLLFIFYILLTGVESDPKVVHT